MIEQNIKELEERSIYILREAQKHFKNMAALWSMGKDSSTMLAIARKALLGKGILAKEQRFQVELQGPAS